MLSYFLETDVGGLRTPDAVGGWRMWFGWVWRDLKPHLSAAGTRLIAGAIDILASLAGKKKILFRCAPGFGYLKVLTKLHNY